MSEKQRQCCAVLRISLDCNACCRKVRRILINIRGVDTHVIEKKEDRIIVCGRFRPSDVVVKLQKKMKRRVEILEVEDLTGGEEGFHDNEPPYDREHEYSEQQPDHMTTPLLC
ncbi:unnamed protein product [Eruca vesicaria subsp. sativa]|uniref:HMA domain-containing protein n=1 Tax=Eruca vesicaria subsp. sativa TaxID=29727 RepID=A0ABC8KSQ6_ERUVS|nr:unnamed protein product [Eruca vesicaria subsp. sativa]